MRVLVALLLSIPHLAFAGAWPRAEGKTFIAVSYNMGEFGNGQPDGYRSVYLEYGLNSKITLGGKIWERADRDHGDALAFAHYHLGSTETGHNFAAGLAFGMRFFKDDTVKPVVIPEFFWGKGFETPIAPGWMSLDVSVGHAFGISETWYKADFTMGLKPNDKTHLIMQLRTFDDKGGQVAALAPSYVRKIHDGVNLELGLTYRMKGENRTGITLGSWIEF